MAVSAKQLPDTGSWPMKLGRGYDAVYLAAKYNRKQMHATS